MKLYKTLDLHKKKQENSNYLLKTENYPLSNVFCKIFPTHIIFQVHPYKLTNAMFERACLRGTQLIKGKLTGIVFGENDKKPKVKGILLNIIKEPFLCL